MMAEDLFLIQRYWGSEDENSADSNNELVDKFSPKKEKNLESVTSEPKLKKRKVQISEFNETNGNDISLLTEGSKNKERTSNNESLKSPKKKVKTPKVKSGNSKDQSQIVSKPSDNSDGNFQIIGEIKEKTTEKAVSILPKWLSNPTIIEIDLNSKETSISDLVFLDESSKTNLEKAGIKFLFPVQQSVIPWLMQTNQQRLVSRPSDICVSAPTGSGKTLSFVLPIVQSLKSSIVSAVRAVVVLPVSELAIQVYEVFKAFVRGTDLKVVLLTGKKSFTAEQKNLVKKGIRKYVSLVDIIVTTPGRLLDHIYRTEGFCLWQLRYLVIDEADSMMNYIQTGWLKVVEEAVRHGCSSSSCVCHNMGGTKDWEWFNPLGCLDQFLQKLLFSATLSRDPEKLHILSLYKPKLFTAGAAPDSWIGKCAIPENLTVQAIVCEEGTKPLVVCHYIKKKQFKRVLCFTESVQRAQRLHLILMSMGIEVREITSNNRPVQRRIILQQFSSGKVNLLVCTDMVARGIDIEDVDCVISYDVPVALKTYIHRIGRTARAGKTGIGLTLLTRGEKVDFFKNLESFELKLPEVIEIKDSDLEEYVDAYRKALTAADSQKRELKKGKPVYKASKKKQKNNIT